MLQGKAERPESKKKRTRGSIRGIGISHALIGKVQTIFNDRRPR
jgi:hypothetical protein